MKKYKWGIALLFLTLFPNFVHADTVDCSDATHACVTCSYQYHHYFNYDITYVVEATGNGTAEIKNTISNRALYGNSASSLLKGGDFINEEKNGLECPDIMAKENISEDDDISITLGKAFSSDSSSNLITLNPLIDDRNDLEFVDPNRENTDLSCDIASQDERLPNVHVSIVNKAVTYTIDSDRYTLDTSLMQKNALEIFKNGCNAKLYMYCDNDVDKCFLTDVQTSGYKDAVGMDETSDEIEKNGYVLGTNPFKPNPLCGKNGELCDISLSNVCYAPTVARTLQFLGFLLFIAKILVPAIIIIMGFINLFKIITSSKPEEAPKYAKNIVLRVVIGIIVFLIPTLANFVFDSIDNILNGESKSKSFENCANCILDTKNCQIYK